MAILFKIIRNGNDFSAKANGGPAFFVGRRVPYKKYIGLYNIYGSSGIAKIYYNAADFAGDFNFWSEFIEPTAYCEGRNFLTLNTYDRAYFTFGFGQFAAHVPNGDFVKFFRRLLGRPEASDYFPHLGIVNGRIAKTDGASPVFLESDETTDGLAKYLNPDRLEVQDAEVIAAAKFIHWTQASVEARRIQVDVMVATYKSFMKRAHHRVGIDGRPARECCVIADILHQGRGGSMTWPLIDAALKSSNPYGNLLKIGEPAWAGRLKTLRNQIAKNPRMISMKYKASTGEFQ